MCVDYMQPLQPQWDQAPERISREGSPRVILKGRLGCVGRFILGRKRISSGEID